MENKTLLEISKYIGEIKIVPTVEMFCEEMPVLWVSYKMADRIYKLMDKEHGDEGK